MKKVIFAVAALLLAGMATQAQNLTKEEVNQIVESGRYKIVVNRAITSLKVKPIIELTSNYDIRITADSIESHLPFFGRAYSGSFDNESPLYYTSTKFEIEKKVKKKRRSESIVISITARPTKNNDIVDSDIEIMENGSTTMSVRSNNLSNITFYGHLEALE